MQASAASVIADHFGIFDAGARQAGIASNASVIPAGLLNLLPALGFLRNLARPFRIRLPEEEHPDEEPYDADTDHAAELPARILIAFTHPPALAPSPSV